MRPLLAFVILTIGHAAYGQSESYPPKLAGLLQSGDYVGINRNADTGTTRITVYPERVFNVLRDAHDLDEERQIRLARLDPLGKKESNQQC